VGQGYNLDVVRVLTINQQKREVTQRNLSNASVPSDTPHRFANRGVFRDQVNRSLNLGPKPVA
jgi:hypothetical protein